MSYKSMIYAKYCANGGDALLPFYEIKGDIISCFVGEMNSFPLHLHKEIELFYVFDGECTVEIGSVKHTLNKGTLAVVFPNEIHSYTISSHAKCLMMIFDKSFCSDFSLVFDNYRPEFPFLDSVQISPETRSALETLAQLYEQSPADAKLVKGYTIIILYGILLQLPLISGMPETDSELTVRVINYVADNYLSAMSLEDISAKTGASRYEISRVFSHRLKIPFNTYLNALRAEYAAHLLVTSNISVTQACFLSGFESQRTFYRAFSERFGVSPGKYRRSFAH